MASKRQQKASYRDRISTLSEAYAKGRAGKDRRSLPYSRVKGLLEQALDLVQEVEEERKEGFRRLHKIMHLSEAIHQTTIYLPAAAPDVKQAEALEQANARIKQLQESVHQLNLDLDLAASYLRE